MLTRRDAMIGSISVGALMRPTEPGQAAQPATPVKFRRSGGCLRLHTLSTATRSNFHSLPAHLYAGDGAARGDGGGSIGRCDQARRDRDPSVYGTDNAPPLRQ